MSNKKQQQYVGRTSQTAEAGNSVPPRYQPPPLPQTTTGILKHSTTKDTKQYPTKAPDNVKVPYQTEPNKFYPTTVPVAPAYKQYPFPYPQNRASTGARTFEEDLRAQSQIHQDLIRGPQRAPEDPSILQHSSDPRIQQRLPVRYPEEEFHRHPSVDMLKFVRKSDADARMPNDTSRHLQMQNLLSELRTLKEANQRLADDNQELRDLCCFLDDDRQKGRKLAREWQRFGRYTASVMRQEVSAYQSKLRELDNKQQELIKDNLELKELCLYLDEERGGSSVCPSCGSSTGGNLRDDGDGSSSSTNADEPAVPQQFTSSENNPPRRSASRERLLHENLARQRSTLNDQTMQYVRNLEQRIKQLEDDKHNLTHKINQLATSNGDPTVEIPSDTNNAILSGRPEAVVRALQVLEVREQLEREGRMPDCGEIISDTTTGDMDDGEKALVREMCNRNQETFKIDLSVELEVCNKKLKEVRDMMSTSPSFQSNKKVETKLAHIFSRLNKIISGDKEILEERNALVNLIMEITSNYSDSCDDEPPYYPDFLMSNITMNLFML
ncbi:hypothetical protein FQA39_LY16619 [Lamprigera yunnana]|nr:hypothetical protein FQA39_LY16619 [Lamprigera yunnana]